jgi:PIN domain nuclease of toxin-antitoxin system
VARYVVDTHALIWFLAKNQRLGNNARQAFNDPLSELILPSIALAEAPWILSSRKLGIERKELLMAIDADPRITVYPLTREIVEVAQATGSVAEMHDRQIVATALHFSSESEPCPILTCDENITISEVVSVVW